MFLRRPLAWLCAAVLVTVVAAAPAPAGASGPAVIVVGGEFNDPAIYDEALRLAGGPTRARVGIITLGSPPAKAKTNGQFYVDRFRARGATDVTWLSIDAGRAHLAEDPALAEAAEGMDVIILGGGDQTNYTDVLLRPDGSDTALLAAIRRGAGSRGVIAGTSAGAAALVDGPMITGGESYDALARPERVTDRARGLGFFHWGLIDTHFAERGRQARLVHLASRHGAALAFGIDENTALVATGGRRPRLRVIGKGGVSIFDLTRARTPRAAGPWQAARPWQIENVRAHYLLAGDAYDPRSRRARIARGKVRDRIRLRARPADRADVFGAYDPAIGRRPRLRSFVRAAAAALSPATRPVLAHPAEDASRAVTLRRGRGAGRYRVAGRAGRSLRNIRVDIR